MDINEYRMLNAMPLDLKVEKTKARIFEFGRRVGKDNIYVSFSGGKDSTVLLDLVRQIYPDTPAVYCDTGIEFPEIKAFAKGHDNVEVIKPKSNFKEILTRFGYPVITKEQSKYIHDIRHGSEKLKNTRLYGNPKGGFKLNNKWKFALDAPFEISDKCCAYMKKGKMLAYEYRTKRRPVVGMLAEESHQRKTMYMRTGCNSFKPGKEKSNPLGFWGEQDILRYIKNTGLPICEVYGEVKGGEELFCTGYSRTGCIYCAYGVHMEDYPNRFQMLKRTHPKLYEYCMGGGEYDTDGMWKPSKEGLGFRKVLDFFNIEY